MTSNGLQSYANERPPSSPGSGEADMATDPASSGFFMNDYKKHEDLKTMLDGSKDNPKLEAMKRIIGMIAKGKDASDLFPAVVKNVVSKNIEVKKLVYVYLTRYAEEQQDLALLSISTFQRALKDPNQLIRGSALRVLSNIRVPVIVPIMMLAIKESVMDMSPFVRKTAAHAIPKLYSLDPEQKEYLVEVIEKLLGDKTTLVAGSAIQAFEEVCPERIDLVHKNFRKLCNLLVDVEEWGQVVIINMLTRYCRTQFVNPNEEFTGEDGEDKAFYSSGNSGKEDSENEGEARPAKKPYIMDPDHRLLLRTCRPLLQSRNAAVVVAVAQFYHHCAPKGEVSLVAKALIRLLRSHKEVQYVALNTITSMTISRKGMFEPFLKSFYVRSNDPTHVKLLKLEILTNLTTETSISTILREFQTYVTSSDKELAAATIHSIGRCASSIPEITDTCLNGLVNLMSNRDEAVVAESVVVIKKLLQIQASEHKDIIVHMAKLVDAITVPMARASILWLIGEYSDRVPKIAPDVLRKMAKNFIEEEDIVKLQILNLAAKLCITNSKQTKLLCQYVFNLAKYDQNYDIRDRARFLRQMILPGEKTGALSKHVKKIFLATKPAPVLESKFKDLDSYQLGTLSHVINKRATGYQELPEWPETAPDSSVRNVEEPPSWGDDGKKITKTKRKKKPSKKKSFYSEDEESSEEEESGDESSSGEDSSESSSEDEESGSEEDSDEENEKNESDGDEESEDESSSEESSSSDEESSSEESEPEVKSKPNKKTPKKKTEPAEQKKDSEVLLDLFSDSGPASTIPPSGVDLLVPLAADLNAISISGTSSPQTHHTVSGAAHTSVRTFELLNRMTGGGLGVMYRFPRTVSIFSSKMVSIELTFTNSSDKPINGLHVGQKKLQPGMALHEFSPVGMLAVSQTIQVTMGVDFGDTTQPATFDLSATGRLKQNVSIKAPVGELLQPITMNENDFDLQQGKLTGMNENTGTAATTHTTNDDITKRVYEAANVLQVPSSKENVFKFASRTISTGVYTLITVTLTGEKVNIKVNCERMVIGQMMVKEIKQSFEK